MKRFYILLIFALVFCRPAKLHSQQIQNDTANYPYWIQMMQDPDANFYKTQRAFEIYWKDRKITKGCGWKVFKRWEYMMQNRINPDGSKPSQDAVYKAYSEYKTNRLPQSQTGNWISLGPAQVPNSPGYEGLGRLNTIAFDPANENKFYVGSPSGGFWRTSDGGQNWTTTTDTIPTLGVSSIVVDYSNPNTLLIGTGDRDAGDAAGLGVFRSTDGGSTWSPSKTGMGNMTVGNMLQHPSNAQIFLAATSGGIYRSIDGGNNWTRTKTGDFKDIKFKPNDPNIVYAASGSNFFRSTDNGQTFNQITSGLPGGQRSVIAVTAANPEYVYVLMSNGASGFQGLYRSMNSGVNFSTRSTSPPNILDWSCDGSGSGGQGWYDLALAASPTNAEIIFAGGVDVWKSINGGTSWTINSHWYGGCGVPAVHADCHYLKYSPVNGSLYACNDGGVYGTPDGGTTWTDHTQTMTIGQIYKLGQSATVREKVINGFQDNGTYTYTASGWLATGGGDGMECAIYRPDASYTFHTVYYGDIYRRRNNTNEAHIAGNGVNGITESGAWVTPFILGKSNPKQMFIGYINIWRCNNVLGGGIHFTKISDNLGGNNSTQMSVLEQSEADTNILYAVRSNNTMFRCDNCLASNPGWINLSAHMPNAASPTSVAAHPFDPDIVYVTAANKVYKSTNKGLSWTDFTGNLPAVHTNTIVCYKNAMEGVYVGTDAGVYYRDNSTNGWVSFSEGLPASARVTELDIFYDNDSVSMDAIRASTYGRGLWGSDMYHASVQADFTANHTTIPIGCSINFTDLSSGVPTYWQWTFTGGTPGTSNLKNPIGIAYSTPGTYAVKMKCWNEFTQDSITKTNYITVSGTLLPAVNFAASKQALCLGDTVFFTDLTENCPFAWIWEFTPSTVTYIYGTSSNSQNPVVVFDYAGSYNVKLTAQNMVGQNSLTRSGYILNGGYLPPFTENFSTGFSTHYWTISNPDYDMTWDTISVAGTTAGGKAAWMNFFNYEAVNKHDMLITPPLMFPPNGPLELIFRHAYAQRVPVKDSLIIKISEDCGQTWTRLWAMGPDGTASAFVTAPPTDNSFYPQNTGEWCSGNYGVNCFNISLANYLGKSNVKLMFDAFNRNGNNLFLTDITVGWGVGIESSPLDLDGLLIYPNPSHGMFTLECRQCRGDLNLSIVSQEGLEVFRKEINAGDLPLLQKIDLSGLAGGIYIVHLKNTQKTKVGKLIIN